jgi:hypothetical protein
MKFYEYISGKEIFIKECSTYTNTKQKYNAETFVLKNTIWICFSHMFLILVCDCHYLCICYLLVNYSFFYRKYMAVLHDYTHFPQSTFHVFKNRMDSLIIKGLLGISHGIPYNLFSIRHIIMHHKGRLQSQLNACATLKMNRSSFLHFIIFYWLRKYFPLIASIKVILACIKCKYYEQVQNQLISMVLQLICIGCLAMNKPRYTLWIVIVPIFISSFFEAYMEWVRRMFINPLNSKKWFTYDIINNTYLNQNSRNENFQNVINNMSLRNWTQIPYGFTCLYTQYAHDNVLIFQNITDIQIGFLVFTGNLEILAKYVVTTRFGGSDTKSCVQYLRQHLEYNHE